MSRVASVTKCREWAGRLKRYEDSSESVARFCQKEGVSQASFYLWKKRLSVVPGSPAGSSSRFLPVQISPPVTMSARQETVAHLGRGIQIEFGSDLAVVEAVVNQLLQAAVGSRRVEDEAC